MSSKLPPLDLTGAVTGTTGVIDFNQFIKFNPMKRDEKAHLRIFNESGCGLDYQMVASGDSDSIPAGGWGVVEIEPNDSQMLLTVTYTLPNPPVSLFKATYFAPGEQVPNVYTLGNSPIGIGGTVNTSSVQTLSNENNPPTPVLIIDIGNTNNASLITIYNNGTFSWSIAGHTLMQGSIANLLRLGQAGDVTEILGKLTVDGISNLDNGAIATDGSGNFNAIGSKTTLNGSIAGTLQYSFPFWGAGIKLMIVTLHGYNSTLKNIPLPSSLSRGWIVATDLGGGTPVLQPKVGSTLVGFNAITALGGAGNGTQSSVSNVKQDSMGSINSTIDNFDFTPGGAADGTIIMIGH